VGIKVNGISTLSVAAVDGAKVGLAVNGGVELSVMRPVGSAVPGVSGLVEGANSAGGDTGVSGL
jgi:hypothetical protein